VIFAFLAVFFVAKFLKLWYYTLYIDKVKKEVINMIKNIIFDCGRVIMQYDERYISSFFADNDEDIELLATVAMSRKYWNAFDEGTLAEEDYLREVKKELPERLHSAVEGLCAKWTSHMPPVPGMEAVVAEIKKAGRGIYLLSNFNKRLRNELYLAPLAFTFRRTCYFRRDRHGKTQCGNLRVFA
jgi:hypothetical protein